MTSDAKIGLLLGLVFIFIIAFIINGLPRFRSNTNNNELTTNMVNSQNDSMGIAAKERKVFNRTRRIEQERVDEVPVASKDEGGIRYERPLTQDIPVVKDNLIVKTDDDKNKSTTVDSNSNRKTRANKPEPVESDWPKIYVVTEGENLGVIAQKFYGPEEGNKRVNVTRIFEANRKLLESPDDIYVGQKLTIPPLKEKPGGIFSGKLFEKVKSIGRKRFSDNPPNPTKIKQNKQYVVREDDNLWRIAAEQLGDGTRFKEISELNAGILEDEDYLTVGMQLRIPAR